MAKVRRRGCIRKRGPNSWLVSFFKYVNENGVREDFSETVKGVRKDAERFLQRKLNEFDNGGLPDNPRLTVNEFFDQWLENHSKVRNSARTAYGDERIYDRYFRKHIGHKRLDALQAIDIQRVYGDLRRTKNLAPQTIKHAHALIRKVLNQAVRWRALPNNPALFVETPKVERKERRVLSAEESREFISACDAMPHGLVFEFALLTGMRPEEFLAVKWEDLDVQRRSVKVRRALVRHNRTWSFNEPKTSRSRRTIGLPEPLVKKLVIHKQKQSFAQQRAKNLWQGHDLIFCGEFGVPLSIPNLTYRYYRPILKKAGLPQIRLYDLRHSHATLLLAADEHPKVVAERLGHSTIVLTLDTYSHVLPTMQKRATDKLEQMIFG
jgi:integrase